MSAAALGQAQDMARAVVEDLGGYGLFGVEFFIRGDEAIFSELSPRPHDTGMVTLISQELSEFDLHARAILGLPIPYVGFRGAAASAVILADREAERFRFGGLEKALSLGGRDTPVDVRLFGKPVTHARGRAQGDRKGSPPRGAKEELGGIHQDGGRRCERTAGRNGRQGGGGSRSRRACATTTIATKLAREEACDPVCHSCHSPAATSAIGLRSRLKSPSLPRRRNRQDRGNRLLQPRRLAARRLVAWRVPQAARPPADLSHDGSPYRIRREGLAAVRAQLDNH
jgi:hypothetical protein